MLSTMSAREPGITEYANRLFERLGDRASDIARDMVLHLLAIGDIARSNDWSGILAAIENLRSIAPGSSACVHPLDPWLEVLIKVNELDKRRNNSFV